MVSNHINIAMIGILATGEIRMILSREKLQIMLNEIALVQEILFDGLL